jgi:hypothetical protein
MLLQELEVGELRRRLRAERGVRKACERWLRAELRSRVRGARVVRQLSTQTPLRCHLVDSSRYKFASAYSSLVHDCHSLPFIANPILSVNLESPSVTS